MVARADLAVYDRDGQLTAVAEVKNKVGTSREWAAGLHRNTLARGGFSDIKFFLLATPDRFYLWKDAVGALDAVEPTYDGDAGGLLASYFARSRLDPSDISGSAFELVVAAWLADLARSDGPPTDLPHEQQWLLESGFFNAVKNGRVEFEDAA